MNAKDKILAILVTIAILGSFLALGWLTKIGGFGIMAEVIKHPQILTE